MAARHSAEVRSMHGPPPGWATATDPWQHDPTYAGPDGRATVWLLAQPTAGQARAGDPLADPGFHHAMADRVTAGRSSSRGLLLGERLAWSRGSGGRTVAGAWAVS